MVRLGGAASPTYISVFLWSIEVDRVELAARDEHLQVNDLGALQIERFQLGWSEGDVSATLIFVSFDDLFFFYLLAGAGVVRPKHDPSCCAGLIFRLLAEAFRVRRRC